MSKRPSPFVAADILLPKHSLHPYWSVVACDQYTSQPEYWERTTEIVSEHPSTLNLILPEHFLARLTPRLVLKPLIKQCFHTFQVMF